MSHRTINIAGIKSVLGYLFFIVLGSSAAPTAGPATTNPSTFCSLRKDFQEYLHLPPVAFGRVFTIETMVQLHSQSTLNARIFDISRSTDIKNVSGVSEILVVVDQLSISFYAYSQGIGVRNSYMNVVPLGTWLHVALRAQENTTTRRTLFELILNNVVVEKITFPNLFPTVYYEFPYIGKSNWDGDPYPDMSISWFRIWNVSLSDSQLSSVAVNGVNRSIATPIVAIKFWSLDLETNSPCNSTDELADTFCSGLKAVSATLLGEKFGCNSSAPYHKVDLLECSWLITTDAHFVRIVFNHFHTKLGFDYVSVYDGRDSHTRRLFYRSGAVPSPIDVITSGQAAFVTFTSESPETMSGFTALAYGVHVPPKKPSMLTGSSLSTEISSNPGLNIDVTKCSYYGKAYNPPNESFISLVKQTDYQSTGAVILTEVILPPRVFRVSFDVLIGGGNGADGMAFSYGFFGSNIESANEYGAGNGLVVSFNTYDNSEYDPQDYRGIVLKISDEVLGRRPDIEIVRLNRFVPVIIEMMDDFIHGGYHVYVEAGGVPIFNVTWDGEWSVDLSWQMMFSARVGGYNDNHFVDKISVLSFSGNATAEIRSDFLGDSCQRFFRPSDDSKNISDVFSHYESYTFNVRSTGEYALSMKSAEFTSFLCLYNTSFNPAAPLENLVAVGSSTDTANSAIFISLTAGTIYIMVATTDDNLSIGFYEVRLVGDIDFLGVGSCDETMAVLSDSLEDLCPMFFRPNTDDGSIGNSVSHYKAYTFTAGTTGTYMFSMRSEYFEPFLSLYNSSLNSQAFVGHQVVEDYTTTIVTQLTAGTTYVLVATTTESQYGTGDYSVRVGGPGNIEIFEASRCEENTTRKSDYLGGSCPRFTRPTEVFGTISDVTPHYQTHTFKVRSSGVYMLFMASPDFTPFVCLYNTSFNATAPLKNLVAVGSSTEEEDSALFVPLMEGTTYIMVTSTIEDSQKGRYEVSIRGPGHVDMIGVGRCAESITMFSDGLGEFCPMFFRPSDNFGSISDHVCYFKTYTFTTSMTGNYTFSMRSEEFEPFLSLYTTSLNTQAFVGDQVVVDFTTLIVHQLTAGMSYVLVATSLLNWEGGYYSLLFEGPGDVDLQGISTCNDTIVTPSDYLGITCQRFSRPTDSTGSSSHGSFLYKTHTFTVRASGKYMLFSASEDFSSFIYLYTTSFNPAAPLRNQVAFGSHTHTDDRAMFTTLTAGTTYILVVTTERDKRLDGTTERGVYTLKLRGPGRIDLLGVSGCDEPTLVVTPDKHPTMITSGEALSFTLRINGDNVLLGVLTATVTLENLNHSTTLRPSSPMAFFFALNGTLTAKFNDLIVTSTPGQLVSLTFAVNLDPPRIKQTLTLQTRRCLSGEVFNYPLYGYVCYQCDPGTFSLDVSGENCKQCPEGGHCYGGSNVTAMRDYWRSPYTNCTDPFYIKCENRGCGPGADFVNSSCPFTSSTTNVGLLPSSRKLLELASTTSMLPPMPICVPGYEGNLCTVCSTNWGRTGLNECGECTGATSGRISTVLAVCVVGVGILALLVYCSIQSADDDEDKTEKDVEILATLRKLNEDDFVQDAEICATLRRLVTKDSEIGVSLSKFIEDENGNDSDICANLRKFIEEENDKDSKIAKMLFEDETAHDSRMCASLRKLIIDYFQVLALIRGLRVPWSAYALMILEGAQTIVAPAERIVSIDCLLGLGPSSSPRPFIIKQIFYACLPIMSFFFSLSAWPLLYYVCKKALQRPGQRLVIDVYVCSVVNIINIVLPLSVSSLTGLFGCIDLGGSRHFLQRDLSIDCDSKEYNILASLFGFALSVYAVGVPLLSALIVYRGQGWTNFSRRFGILYKGYRVQLVLYETFIAIRKNILAATIAYFTHSPQIQGLLATGILIIALFFDLTLDPWDTPSQKRLNVAFLAIAICTLYCGQYFFATDDHVVSVFLTVVVVGSNIIFWFIWIVLYFFYARKNIFRHFRRTRSSLRRGTSFLIGSYTRGISLIKFSSSFSGTRRTEDTIPAEMTPYSVESQDIDREIKSVEDKAFRRLTVLQVAP